MDMILTSLLSAGSAIWIAEVVRRMASTRRGGNPGYAVQQTASQAFHSFRRLFSAQEKAFLEEYPGMAKQLGRQLDQNRRGVFQVYLEQLKSEHASASRELRALAVELDRPDLAREAIRRDLGFSSCYWVFRLQLATGLPVTPRTLSWVGISKAQPATATKGDAAYADMERTAVR